MSPHSIFKLSRVFNIKSQVYTSLLVHPHLGAGEVELTRTNSGVTILFVEAAIRKYISVHKDVCHGKPCFRGTRIPVSLVLQMLEGGDQVEDILRGYPSLTKRAVQAGLHFASEVVEDTRLSAGVLSR